MLNPQALPEDNPRSHELFAEAEAILAKMAEHRPDDLIGLFHNLLTKIEATTFPALIVGEDGRTMTCPYCEQEVVVDATDFLDVAFYDIDLPITYYERAEREDGTWHLLSGNDGPADWTSMYSQHECGGAVSIPPTIHVEFF